MIGGNRHFLINWAGEFICKGEQICHRSGNQRQLFHILCAVGDVAVKADVDNVDRQIAGIRGDDINRASNAAHLLFQRKKARSAAKIANQIISCAAGNAGNFNIGVRQRTACGFIECSIAAAGVKTKALSGCGAALDQRHGVAGRLCLI